MTAEFVIIFPLFALLLFGMWSLALGWYNQHGMVSAAREGARMGATYPTSEGTGQDGFPNNAWFAAVWDVTHRSTLMSWNEMCIAYVGEVAKLDETAIATQRRIYVNNSSTGTSSSQPCFDDGRGPTERRVQVVVQRDQRFWTFGWGSDITVAGQSMTRYETPYPRD